MPTISALAPFRHDILVVSGLNSLPTRERPGGAHAKASTRFLTNVSPPTSETWLDVGISMDQILANDTGKYTQLPSLELSMESGETSGACDTGYACPYTSTIVWKSANTPLPTQNNPRVVFERLFGDAETTDPKVRLARMRQQRSVLDSVTQEVAHLQGSLPAADRVKLTEWLPFDEAFKLLLRADVGLIAFQPGIQNHVFAMQFAPRQRNSSLPASVGAFVGGSRLARRER